ncbi:ribonuclease HI [Microvirga calopogonii]|uniref:ribonuclease HI n=1 Tax=Microvirga calopogonii TaxID=2078013 RepID=UPI000E0CBF86
MFDNHFLRDAAGRLVVQAYIDGACSGNPGPGGFGVVILDRHGRAHSLSGFGGSQTTNNKMELSAAIALLDHFKAEECTFTIHADSQYVIKGITEWIVNWKRNNWRNAQKKPVENQDLWQELDRLASKQQIKWQWVRGHNGNQYNEMADQLAVNAGRGTVLEPDWNGANEQKRPSPPKIQFPVKSSEEQIIAQLERALATGSPADLRDAAQAALDHLKSR